MTTTTGRSIRSYERLGWHAVVRAAAAALRSVRRLGSVVQGVALSGQLGPVREIEIGRRTGGRA